MIDHNHSSPNEWGRRCFDKPAILYRRCHSRYCDRVLGYIAPISEGIFIRRNKSIGGVVIYLEVDLIAHVLQRGMSDSRVLDVAIVDHLPFTVKFKFKW